MSIFIETAIAIRSLDNMEEDVQALIENEYIPEKQFSIFEVFDDDPQDNQTIGSPEEIANEPKRQGQSHGGDRMIIVLLKNDEGKWVPGFFRKTSGEYGRIVNKKKQINKRATTDQLKKLSDRQLESTPIRRLKDKYPTAVFYKFDPSAGSDKPGEWALQT